MCVAPQRLTQALALRFRALACFVGTPLDGQIFPVNPQSSIDHFLCLGGSSSLAYVVFNSFGGGYDERTVGVGLHLTPYGSPCAAVAGELECVFRPAQKMVSKYGDPDVRPAALGELVMEWVQSQIAFHTPKGIFHPYESDVEFP